MIRLSKLPKPRVLAKNERTWREEYLRYIREGRSAPKSTRFRYRHSDIKSAIRRETADKCAYCESKISHSQPGDTEHIRPVSKFPAEIVLWENLTLVCRACNAEKSDYHDEAEPLVHPYQDDPEAHIHFLGPLACHKPADGKGLRTVRLLDLNRSGLIERRNERLLQLSPLVDQWAACPEGPTKNLLRDEIATYAAKDREYSASIRCFLQQHAGLSF